MRTFIAATALATVLALTGASQAAEISSPGIFGVVFQFMAECVVYNAGKTPLQVTVKIVGHNGSSLETYNCGGPLGAGQFCAVNAGWGDGLPLDDGIPVACVATAPSVANLRGTMVIQERVPDDFGGFSLQGMRSTPLR